MLTSYSDKEDAAANYKGGFGFHPIVGHLDETNEALAGVLRPGNAGAQHAGDHEQVLTEVPNDAGGTPITSNGIGGCVSGR